MSNPFLVNDSIFKNHPEMHLNETILVRVKGASVTMRIQNRVS